MLIREFPHKRWAHPGSERKETDRSTRLAVRVAWEAGSLNLCVCS